MVDFSLMSPAASEVKKSSKESPDSGAEPTWNEREWAWLGDAVLTLYAREQILRFEGRMDGPKAVRMTNNQFLAAVGRPTGVEAQIGRIYFAEGLSGAFGWIEEKLVPLFRKQEARHRTKVASGGERRSQG
jgi:hypothetical protein